MRRDGPLAVAAIMLCVQISWVALLSIIFGGDTLRVTAILVIEFLKPVLVVLTLYRVGRHPPEGAGQLRMLAASLWNRDWPDEIGPFLLATELVGAILGIIGFAGVVFFADFSTATMLSRLSLALLFGFGPIYLEGSVVSLAVFSLGITIWTASWVLEGLALTATNPLPR